MGHFRITPCSTFHLALAENKDICCCCFSVAQSCPTHCDTIEWSKSGFPVPTTLTSVIPFSSRHQPFPTSGSFQMCQFFASGGQSIGISASASVLTMKFRIDLLQNGLVGSPCSPRGLSRVFSNTTVQKHQFSALSFLQHSALSPTLTSIHDYQKDHSLD